MRLSRLEDFRDRLGERFPELSPPHPVYKWLVLGSVMIGTFMAVLDSTIVIVALPKLMATFGVPVDTVEWVLTAYLLVFGVMLTSSGWFADRWGYKRIYQMGIVLFTVGSFLSSLSWNIGALIVFRVVQGAGGGILMPVGMAIVIREFPKEKRGIALAFWGIAASASVSLGPTTGGYLIDHYSWQTIFDINVPLGIIGLFVTFIILREYRAKKNLPFDLVGFAALVVFLTSLLLALASGNASWNVGGWTSNFIITTFGFAFVGFVVFLINEIKTPHPLIALPLFRNYNFSLGTIALFIFGLGLFGSNFLLPVYVQNSLGYSPLQAGLLFLPVGIMLMATAPVAGLITDRFGGKFPVIAGLLLMGFTFYQFSFLSYLTDRSQLMLPLFIRGLAMGLIFAPLTTITISEVANEKMAQASGLLSVIRQIGGSFGVAIFGSVLSHRVVVHNTLYGQSINPYAETTRNALAALQLSALQSSGGTAADALTRAKGALIGFVANQAFIQSVNDVFRISAIIIVTSTVFVILTRNPKKNRKNPPMTG
jgi:DHA2 family multidrug resistance protein